MNDFITGIITGIVGSLIAAGIITLLLKIILSIKSTRSPFNGKWVQEIFKDSDDACEGEFIKRDELEVTANKNGHNTMIKGIISRQFPLNEKNKKWKFKGSVIGENIFCIFWSIDRPIGSCGCWLQRHKSDNSYQGFYLKYENEVNKICITPFKTTKQDSHK